jgi:hypothetical protein
MAMLWCGVWGVGCGRRQRVSQECFTNQRDCVTHQQGSPTHPTLLLPATRTLYPTSRSYE